MGVASVVMCATIGANEMCAIADAAWPQILPAVLFPSHWFSEPLRMLITSKHPTRGAMRATRSEAIKAIGEQGLPAVRDPVLGHYVPVA